jgi:hypothetical protein
MAAQLHRSTAAQHDYPALARRAAHRRRRPPPPPILPEDSALYVCGCGHVFMAAVTASVSCPACGRGQPW